MIELDMNRKPMVEIDWFNQDERLAIADIVYVAECGLCSHQPSGQTAKGTHRVRDLTGRIHLVRTDRLFDVTSAEIDHYWKCATWI